MARQNQAPSAGVKEKPNSGSGIVDSVEALTKLGEAIEYFFSLKNFISKRQKEELGDMLLEVQSILSRNTIIDVAPVELNFVDDDERAAAMQFKKYCTLYFTSGNAPTIPMTAPFFYTGGDVNLEMWKPGPTGRTVPMPEERFMDKPNMVPFLHTYSNGEESKVVHFQDGLLMRHDDWLDLKALFCKAWPTTYGTKSKGKKSGQVSKAPSKDHLSGRTLLHGKSVEAQEHRDAFIRLIQAIWPSDSYLQFFGLRAIKHRSLFHSERLRLATKVCEYLWALMICSWRKTYDRVVLKFDKEGVGNFIESCLRRVNETFKKKLQKQAGFVDKGSYTTFRNNWKQNDRVMKNVFWEVAVENGFSANANDMDVIDETEFEGSETSADTESHVTFPLEKPAGTKSKKKAETVTDSSLESANMSLSPSRFNESPSSDNQVTVNATMAPSGQSSQFQPKSKTKTKMKAISHASQSISSRDQLSSSRESTPTKKSRPRRLMIVSSDSESEVDDIIATKSRNGKPAGLFKTGVNLKLSKPKIVRSVPDTGTTRSLETPDVSVRPSSSTALVQKRKRVEVDESSNLKKQRQTENNGENDEPAQLPSAELSDMSTITSLMSRLIAVQEQKALNEKLKLEADERARSKK